jgi:hypothetical protein
MSRLTHSAGGFLRSLQISSTQVFAFVEGRLDRPFFDRLLSQICSISVTEYKIFAMKELPSETGGKASLITMFQDFRKRGLLVHTAFGKSMVCLFLADKDCDDFTGKRLRSSHLVYSPTYDLEGHLFSCGNLTMALSDACGITTEQAKSLVPNAAVWLQTIAVNWKEWTALCMISQARGINTGCTFDRISQVNPNPLSTSDSAKVLAYKAELSAALAINQQELDSEFKAAVRRIERSIQIGNPMRYFKGKWLSHIIQRHLESKPRIPDANISGAGERLNISLVSQVAVHANCSCCSVYTKQIHAVLALVKPNL